MANRNELANVWVNKFMIYISQNAIAKVVVSPIPEILFIILLHR